MFIVLMPYSLFPFPFFYFCITSKDLVQAKNFVLCAGANGSELENENEEPYSIL